MSNTSGGSFGDSSLVSQATQSSFDVRSERDVISLLRLVHVNTIDPEIKNHLRDLVFTYRQTLSPEDGKKLQQNFAALGVTIVYTDAPAQRTPVQHSVPTLGSSRPQPVFRSVAAPQSVVSPVVESTSVPVPKVAEPVVPVAPIQETVVVKEPKPSVPAPEVVVPTPAPVAVNTDANTRIKEIKRLVNEKIGNPVNLIDAHETVGREYMTALLEAMKKANGAPQGELTAAMTRLETAFASVQSVINSDGAVGEAVNAASDTRTVPLVSSENKASEVAPVAEVTEEVPQAQQEPKSEPEPEPMRARLTASGGVTPVTPTRMSSVRQNLVENAVIEAKPQPLVQEITTQTSPIMAEVAQMAPQEPQESPDSAIHSVAKEKQLQDLLQRNRQKEVQTKQQQEDARVAQMDPLQTPEVTAGLNQLLSEWSLFRSSGLFGTGPNGSDHPLYKKLSTLTMAAVIAGRFEGATPVIKQSVTDYMNGWRYEEGIVHEHMETFEHYLRKVVRHILNRKKVK